MASRSTAELISDCVHCGFCLPVCPTYRSWGLEMDSPRGRIDLMKGLEEGAVTLDARAVSHFDLCLGCMACVPACPSGVRYDLLIESTRAKVEADYARPGGDRAFRELVFALFPHPLRLRALAFPLFLYERSGLARAVERSGLLKLLPPRLRQLASLAPKLSPTDLLRTLPAFTAARGTRRGSVALISGCVQRVFFPSVNRATIRVLSAEGFDVAVPRGQGCCGALSLHVGRDAEARDFARALIESIEAAGPFDAVLVNAAGCGSALKQYGELFAADDAWRERAQTFAEKVKDVNEFLAQHETVAERRPLPLRVAYHDACHLAQAQGIREQPRALLRGVAGLELLEIPGSEVCCGSAGVYNLLQPAAAAEIGERKAADVLASGADVLVSANPGCTLQIRSMLARQGVDLPAAHPVEILDAALA
ncbi:MAG: (Fe-S)-binding protein [Vulcanimicrobiaceae bacterium]